MTAAERDAALLKLVDTLARGPRRESAFAVWLTVRVALDAAAAGATDRNGRRRLTALEKRLSSLTLTPAIRRALAGTLATLREEDPERAVAALGQLGGPVRDLLGAEGTRVVRDAVEEARARVAAASGRE